MIFLQDQTIGDFDKVENPKSNVISYIDVMSKPTSRFF